MEVVRLIQSVQGLLLNVRNLVEGDQELQRKIKTGLIEIKLDLGLLSADLKKAWADQTNQGAVPEEWILQLQDLGYEIEDFIYERHADTITSAPLRLLQVALVKDPRKKHLDRIEYFQKRIKVLQGRMENAAKTPTGQQVTPGPTMAGTSSAATSSASLPENTSVAQPVGMEEAKSELRKLLLEADGDQKKLKVISILGCSGSGKTNLVRALYEDDSIMDPFRYCARVDAPSSPDPNHVSTTVNKILQQVVRGDRGEAPNRATDLEGFLRDKRYLVIIDGVQEYKVWIAIRAAFPKNELGSRVVITTRNRSVARGCSSGSYLFTMPGLDYTHRADLFWARYGHRLDMTDDLKPFLDKSDGLPLVLVGGADFLLLQGLEHRLTVKHCQDLGNRLANHIASGKPGFEDMRKALAQCCDSLPEHGKKMCMLSVSSFPKGHVIKRKSLIRRWIAEGLVVADVKEDEDSVALDRLKELLNLGIVDAAPGDHMSTNSEVNRCQVHGVMLEFLVHRSLSWNYLSLIKDGELVPNRGTICSVRRLCIHGAGEIDGAAKEIELSRIRSLTMCNCNINNLSSLKGCKMLRLLDLEGCSWLSNDHLGTICSGLQHLKYLSLRNTNVSELPSTVGDLHCLETLDVRHTQINTLPMEVLKFPQLAHLFGKFELPCQLQDANLEDNLKKLHTLAGFKIVNNQGFEQILHHANKLKKVKIWCDVPITTLADSPPTPVHATPVKDKKKEKDKKKKNKKNVPNAANIPNCSSLSFKSLVKRFTGPNYLHSLSIDLGDHCKHFLDYVLKDTCLVSSIKIKGLMNWSDDFTTATLTTLRFINELYLCNSGLPSEKLSVLQSLPCLESLKLAEKSESGGLFWQGDFIVNTDGFRRLKRLCFDGPKLPNVKFEEGSMRYLLSLQLICVQPTNGLGVTGFTNLQMLDEVILHPNPSPGKLDAWKSEAARHRNRPYVKIHLNSHGA